MPAHGPVQQSRAPLSEEQRQTAAFVLDRLASIAAILLEAIVLRLLELESDSLARRVTVGLPREAGLRVILVCVRGFVAALDAKMAAVRPALVEAQAGADRLDAIGPDAAACVSVRASEPSGDVASVARDRAARTNGGVPARSDHVAHRLASRRAAVVGWVDPPSRRGGKSRWVRGVFARLIRCDTVLLT